MRLARAALAAAPVTFLAVFLLWPVSAIVWRGIAPVGTPDLAPLLATWTSPATLHLVGFTVAQAAASTVLTLAVGLPGAWALSRLRFPGRRAVRALVTTAFVLPTVVVATAVRAALTPFGAGDGLIAILVAHVMFNYAVVVRTVGGLWAHLDPDDASAARVLGAGRVRTFWHVTLPALLPAIAAAAAVTFLFTFCSFGVVLLLGGGRLVTLEVEIWRRTAQLLDLPAAAALTLLQLGCVIALVALQGRLVRSGTGTARLASSAAATHPPRSAAQRWALAANLGVVAVLIGWPLLTLVEASLHVGHDWSLQGWATLGATPRIGVLAVSPLAALANSLRTAAIATVLATTLGTMGAAALVRRPARRRSGPAGPPRLLDIVLLLPLGVSAVTVGFGFLLALDTPIVDLRTSPLLIPLAHAIVAIPLVVRASAPVLASVATDQRSAARLLGASPWQAWWAVDAPAAARAIATGAAFAACVSLGEFGATLFIARPDAPTLPVAIYRLLAKPGALNVSHAMALAVLLAAVTGVVVWLLERARLGRDGGEF